MTFPLPIEFHFLTDVLSIFIAYRYYLYLKSKTGDFLPEDTRFVTIVGAATGALIGSRLLAFIEHFETASQLSWMYIFSSKTIVGGVIGGIIGVEIAKKFLKIKTATGDLLTFPLILGIIIGRIGCFFTGVFDGTVGNVTTMPWGMNLGDGLIRHPTSLYEIIFLVIMFYVLKKISKGVPMKPGLLFRLFVASYLVFRFCIEYIKPITPLFIGLSAIQLASLVFALYYIYSIVFVYGYRPFNVKEV
ncbi:MAG: prolipoprotein diacylglyceryl transferase family protein [Patescibacteria group bacterium]